MDKGYNVQSTYSSTRSVYTFKPQRMRHLGYFALKKKKNYHMIKNFLSFLSDIILPNFWKDIKFKNLIQSTTPQLNLNALAELKLKVTLKSSHKFSS